MANLQGLINQYMVAPEPSEMAVSGVTSLIVGNEVTLLQFVQLLGKFLTEESEVIRAKANLLICDVLEDLPKNKLSIKDCYFLMEFFISRLDDDFKNSVVGIESIIKMNNFKSTELIDQILTKIEQTYEPRQLLAKNRYVVFKILSELLARFLDYALSINDLFVKTFIKISTGEKDPRNLLISFDLNYKISTQFNISQFAEDLFDNSFCYFPISFKPPPNDPYKISSESLKEALRKVLACNSKFAKDCIPNLIEKLTSTSSLVKLDSLYTLSDCIDNYSTDTVKQYSLSIWNSLKYEILHNELQNVQSYEDITTKYSNSNIEEDHVLPVTLSLFQKLFIKLTEPTGNGEAIEDYVTTDVMLTELIKNLESLDGKQAKQSAAILSFLASTSATNFNLIVEKSFPALISNSSLPVPLQRLLITYLSFFFDAYKVFSISQSPSSDLRMLGYKDEILVQLSRSLMSSSQSEISLRCLAIQGLNKLTKLPKFLESSELNLIVQYLTEVLLTDDNQTTSKEALSSLVDISEKFPELILELTIPQLLLLLPDSDAVEEISDVKPINTKEKIIEILSTIVENKQIMDVIMIRLLNKLAVLSSNESSPQYIKLILSTMIDILVKTKEKMSESGLTLKLEDYLSKFVPQYLFIILSNESFYENDILLEVSSKLIKLIIVNTDSSLHQEIVNSIFAVFINGDSHNPILSKPINFQIKLLDNPGKLIILFVKILSAVDRTTTTLPLGLDAYVQKLVSICQLDSLVKTPYVRLGYLQNLSLVVNKYLKSTALVEAEFEDLLSSSYIKDYVDLAFFKKLEVLTWVTKALILKDDPLAEKYENFITGLLANDNAGLLNVASKSIEVLIANCELFDTYTKTVTVFGKQKSIVSNVDIRLLYKQKFFNIIIPMFVKSFKDNESPALKKNYLISLSLVLKYVDDSIISSHIEQVFPLISKSLFFDVGSNAAVIRSSLNIVMMSLQKNSQLVQANLKTILPRLLELANNSSSDENIKLTSLKCLIEICNKISISTVMDYRDGVIRNLGYALDDRKRSVRKAAADCRQLFYDLGQAKE